MHFCMLNEFSHEVNEFLSGDTEKPSDRELHPRNTRNLTNNHEAFKAITRICTFIRRKKDEKKRR